MIKSIKSFAYVKPARQGRSMVPADRFGIEHNLVDEGLVRQICAHSES